MTPATVYINTSRDDYMWQLAGRNIRMMNTVSERIIRERSDCGLDLRKKVKTNFPYGINGDSCLECNIKQRSARFKAASREAARNMVKPNWRTSVSPVGGRALLETAGLAIKLCQYIRSSQWNYENIYKGQ